MHFDIGLMPNALSCSVCLGASSPARTETAMVDGPRVLAIDDEIQIRRFLRTILSAEGYHVDEAATGGEGLQLARRFHPDLVILDLGLPDQDGLEVLVQLRQWSQVPVIILSVRDSQDDKVALLDAGADDYLTKPFGVQELLARLRTLRRHYQLADQSSTFESGHLRVDLARRQVWNCAERVRMTNHEYALLHLLLRNLGRVLTHQQILRAIWGVEHVEDVHYLRACVATLRQKLEVDPGDPCLIVTEPGVGYRLMAPH